jgi:C-terminal processing protease CtpA/Prc
LQKIVCPFGGLGVHVEKDGNFIKVIRVIDKTPAEKAGVKVNDIVTHLDDESVDGMTLNEAVEKMRGQPNTEIKLRIVREGQGAPIELSITRGVVQSVQAPSAQWPPVQAPSAIPSAQWPSVQVPSVQWPSVQGQVQQ